MKPQAFIFIGRSGCGKGTQAGLLMKKLKEIDAAREILYIQTGGEFRKFIQGQSFTEKLSHDYYMTDKLQPEFLAVHMWVRPLVEEYKGNQHLVLDGTPRKPGEGVILDSVFGFYGFEKPIVIVIEISEEESLKRLAQRKRLDDAPDDVKKRLQWYQTDVVPTIEHFRNDARYQVMDINGERSVEEIHADIVKRVGLL